MNKDLTPEEIRRIKEVKEKAGIEFGQIRCVLFLERGVIEIIKMKRDTELTIK